jgi:hypothetical protein
VHDAYLRPDSFFSFSRPKNKGEGSVCKTSGVVETCLLYYPARGERSVHEFG